MRGALTALTLTILLLSSMLVLAIPTIEVYYAEILSYDGKQWESKYYTVVGGAITFTVRGGLILVVRTDSYSPIRPSLVKIDGGKAEDINGSGMLWDSYIVFLGGGVHRVTVFFEKSPPMPPVVGIFSPLPENEIKGKTLIEVPELPGFKRAGIRAKIVLSSDTSLENIVPASYFILNKTTVKILGEQFSAYDIIIPYVNVTLNRGFVHASYQYLYYLGADKKKDIVLPPYRLRLAYINYPANITQNQSGAPNIIAGDPPRPLLSFLNQNSFSVSLTRHRVRVFVSTKNTCNGQSITYALIPPPNAQIIEKGNMLDLGENTTLRIRFFKNGVAALDYMVYTPPPRLLVNAPFYGLTINAVDIAGEPLPHARFTLYREGTVYSSGVIVNGSAHLCPVPEGRYSLTVSVAGRVIGSGKIYLDRNRTITLVTNATTLKVIILRKGTSERLSTFRVILQSKELEFEESAKGGGAVIKGIPLGNYSMIILYKGQKVFSVHNIQVTAREDTVKIVLPIYSLKVRVVGFFGQPVSNVNVTARSDNFTVTAITGRDGIADLGMLPEGDYVVDVGPIKTIRISLRFDTANLVETDVVGKINGVYVRGSQVIPVALSALLLTILLAIRRMLGKKRKKPSGVVEV